MPKDLIISRTYKSYFFEPLGLFSVEFKHALTTEVRKVSDDQGQFVLHTPQHALDTTTVGCLGTDHQLHTATHHATYRGTDMESLIKQAIKHTRFATADAAHVGETYALPPLWVKNQREHFPVAPGDSSPLDKVCALPDVRKLFEPATKIARR